MTTGTIEFRMLGPLEARLDGTAVPLGGPKQRALVALLLLRANDVVPLDVLVDELWDGTPPPSATAYVQNCIARLRKVVGPETVETRPPGYRLRIDPDRIDAQRFERLVRTAREMPARERAAALREALALWRGTPLSDLAYKNFTQDVIRNLEEQRVHALQVRLEADLELGRHREAIGELDALAREHPTHERLRWLQMLALHRSDRRLDALAAYQEARLAIVEESGMEPGEELRALQRRILQDDPTLMPGGTAEAVAERPPQLARKVVALCILELLVDDALDVEAARGVVSRGLASLEEIVVRHGGRVEQLLGEEALAVFGLPAAHEDDVLRALRSAVELRDALSALGIRAAVETGEVLVGEDGRVLSGGALTTARRAKEGASEQEILLGPAAAARSAGAAWTEPSEGGRRLVELVEGAPAIPRRPDAPLVGRRAELERLVVAVRETAASSSCRRIVVLGEPGIGKTRLAAVLVRSLAAEARVLTGRCVPYAEGATYLPLAEIVEQIVGGDERGPAIDALLADEPDGERAASRLDDALAGSGAVDSGDVFWAARKLFERVAREEPLLVVLEDVHWAEPGFLDLLEYLVGWSAGAPIALVCLARTELLDARPAWAADTLALRPLADDETAELLDALPESLALDAAAQAAVVAAAEGNPLFLEQLAAHALDAQLDAGRVPASLESLLASRLDTLGSAERDVLERAAIVGREFTRAAVDALSEDEARGSATELLALVRRRLVRPDGERAVDDAFLFDHALIRDATYGAIAKSQRARLHERLARWLEGHGALDELVGHHLERAAVSLADGGNDASTLAAEASERLGRAGERALWSGDHRAAVALLTKAIALLPDTDTMRLELECVSSISLKNLWERDRALELLDDVASRAARVGNRRLGLRAWVEQLWPRFDELTDPDSMLAKLEAAIVTFEEEGDVLGAARGWHMLAAAESLLRGRFDAATVAALRSEACYARHGVGTGIAATLVIPGMVDGTATIAEASRYCVSQLERPGLARLAEGIVLAELAVLRALEDDLDDAHGLLERSRSRLLDVGADAALDVRWSLCATQVALLARDPLGAEAAVASAVDAGRAHDRSDLLSHALVYQAEIALLEGEPARARTLAEEARAHANRGDVFRVSIWRRAMSRALAALERLPEAEALAREGVTLVDSTDFLIGRGEARMALADVLAAAQRPDEAAAAAEEGVALFELKGATLLAARARERLTEIRGGEPDARAPLERA